MTDIAIQAQEDTQVFETPAVSVIIPAYNTAPYIAETLSSVFAQTFTDFEVILVNDGSHDTGELEQALVPYGNRIVYIKQANLGAGVARNTGIKHARGKYLAFLDSDDSWLPDYLASQMKAFDEIPLLDVVYCDAKLFGDRVFAGRTFMQTYPSNGPVTLESLISKKCHVPFLCTMARRQVVVDAGAFDESLPRCEDYDLLLRILYRGGRMMYHKKVLGRYRIRPGSMSQDAVKVSKALIAIYKNADKTMELPKEIRAKLQKQIALSQAGFDLETGRNLLVAGDFSRAKDSLTRANNFFSRAKLKVVILGLKWAPSWTRLAVITWVKLISCCD